LNTHNIEAFSASDIFAPHRVIAPHHIALRLGKTSPVTIICPARQLRLLSPNDPLDLIFSLLPAVRTGHRMRTLLRPLIKKVPFFHIAPHWRVPELFLDTPPLQSCLTPPLASKSDA
jgi:hypothetical protein